MQLHRRGFLASAAAGTLFAPSLARAMQTPLAAAIRLDDRRVLMDCNFSGQAPMPFVIDTGGTLGLIRDDLARSLGLRRIGEQRLRLRAGNRPYRIYEARDFLLGGVVRQGAITFAGVEGIFPPEHAGSLPAGILTELPAELAMGDAQWRLWPDGGPARPGWTAFIGTINEAINPMGSPLLYADLGVGGTSVRVGLDTGMPFSNYLYRSAAEPLGLWNAARWAPAPPGGRGRVVLADVTPAGLAITNMPITMVEEPEWAEFPNGILGLGTLRRFDIATDPGSRTTWLRPNGNPGLPNRYNRFGAWIERRGNELSIGTIGPGSPAEAAGLQRGDSITGIGFEALIEAMQQPAGTQLPLTVTGRNGRRALAITLADYL